MCGLCGELRFDGSRPDRQILLRMIARLERRGPDAAGDYADGPVTLGHRRLSIIDLSERSNQPLVDRELGLCLLYTSPSPRDED